MSEQVGRMINAKQAAEVLNISVSFTYKVIGQLNKELRENGFLTIPGKVDSRYSKSYTFIFHRTLLFFLKGYTNSCSALGMPKTPGKQKKNAIQAVLNTPMGQAPCIAGFLDTHNKRIDRSIDTMLRSNFGCGRGI